ncbi:MAG: UDP-N-acetylglucosamine 1-carboxyvinyltransferase, partial [Candidatus Komeilibacteria bacterium RIFCSPHIGHO2_01_FULL_52_14]
VIQGGKKLHGTVPVQGAKNAAAPIIAATVLIEGTVTLHNVPKISDVITMLSILEDMGARIRWTGHNSVELTTGSLDVAKMDYGKVSKIRASILFLGCLAHRFGSIRMSLPGGCKIGSRPVDAHLEALRELGFAATVTDDYFDVHRSGPAADVIVMKEFSVTATENAIVAAVLGKKKVTIKCCAAEHVVQDLCWFLQAAGAHIDGIGTHTVGIRPVASLSGCSYTIMPDPIDAGSFIALAAATQSELVIQGVAPDFLSLEMKKFEEIGLQFEIDKERRDPGDHYVLADIHPKKIRTLRALKKLHSMPYPGFAADLLQPFTLVLTQAQGISLVHDWMYDGRFRYVTELQSMGANITILDPHRILVIGPTPLYGKELTGYDLRAGMTLIMAGLVAEGTTKIHGADQVDRGYERLDQRLTGIGAMISRE